VGAQAAQLVMATDLRSADFIHLNPQIGRTPDDNRRGDTRAFRHGSRRRSVSQETRGGCRRGIFVITKSKISCRDTPPSPPRSGYVAPKVPGQHPLMSVRYSIRLDIYRQYFRRLDLHVCANDETDLILVQRDREDRVIDPVVAVHNDVQPPLLQII
jgi:hypothetical protein